MYISSYYAVVYSIMNGFSAKFSIRVFCYSGIPDIAMLHNVPVCDQCMYSLNIIVEIGELLSVIA